MTVDTAKLCFGGLVTIFLTLLISLVARIDVYVCVCVFCWLRVYHSFAHYLPFGGVMLARSLISTSLMHIKIA